MVIKTDILAAFPKSRPPISQKHKDVFDQEYKLNRESAASVEGLAKKLEAWMHRKVVGHMQTPVLEIGAGTLNHLKFEKKTESYDIVEPYSALFEGKPEKEKLRNIYSNIADIPEEAVYKRIISVAVLEHMTHLPAEAARCGLLLDGDGIFQAGIPSEGGLLWGLAWRCTTGLSYWLRNKINYKTVMRHEHVNTAQEIISVLEYFFEDVRLQRFPFPWLHMSFYSYIEARRPKLETCRDYLEQTRCKG